jgi:hypothetical protein
MSALRQARWNGFRQLRLKSDDERSEGSVCIQYRNEYIYIFWYGTVTFMSTQMAPLHPTSIQGFATAGAAAAAG